MRRSRRKGQIAALRDVLPSVMPSSSAAELRAMLAFGWWNRAVPPRVAQNAQPVRLDRGLLTIHTRSSSWAQELDFLRPQLLASVQRQAPNAAVRALRVAVGPFPEPPPDPRASHPARATRAHAVLPEELARALARIGDDEVRQAIERAAAAALGTPAK